ncbi:hypothetical protein QZH41_008988, partial [Actinostola sp. cb2023]
MSVNDGINPEEFTLQYVRIDEIIAMVYREFHLDLQWWHQFLASWHGVNFWLYPGMPQTYDLEVTSDAAGVIGFGAFYKDEWFK